MTTIARRIKQYFCRHALRGHTTVVVKTLKGGGRCIERSDVCLYCGKTVTPFIGISYEEAVRLLDSEE